MIDIYKITCLETCRSYVGSTNCFITRKSLHKTHLSKNKHASKSLQKDFDEFGFESLEFNILERCRDEERNNVENFWMALFGQHNVCFAGESPAISYKRRYGRWMNEGCKESEETIRKRSIAATGKTHSKETLEKLRLAHLGKKLTEEHKSKLSKYGKENPNKSVFKKGCIAPNKGRHKITDENGKTRYIR